MHVSFGDRGEKIFSIKEKQRKHVQRGSEMSKLIEVLSDVLVFEPW